MKDAAINFEHTISAGQRC